MPIYEYKCDNGHVFDVVQRMTDEALTECQDCGVPAVRVLHSPAVHFKGSGFYNTDYGKKSRGNGVSEGAKESGDSKASESSSGSSDSGSGSSDSGSSSSGSKSSDSKPATAATSGD